MRSLQKYSLLMLTLFVLTAGSVHAQSRHVTGASLGLGGGGTAYLNSYHANFVNPANLMLSNNEPKVSIGLLGGISTSGGGSLANISVYNQYFTQGITLTDDVAAEALDKWFGVNPSNMRSAGMQFEAIPIGASYRNSQWAASLALRTRVLTSVGMSKGLAQLGIHGLDGAVFASPRAVDMKFDAMSVAEISAGYAMKIAEIDNLFGLFKDVQLMAGVAPKLLLGTNYSQMDFKSTFQITRQDNYIDELYHDFAYSFETTGQVTEQLNQYYNDRQNSSRNPDLADYVEPGASDFVDIKGSGFGLDLGVTAQMKFNMPLIGGFSKGEEQLRVGLSVTDLGGVTFDSQFGRFVADDALVWDGIELDQDRIDNEFNGDAGEYYNHVLADSIGSGIYGSFAPEQTQSTYQSLPSMINFGSQLTLNKLSIAVDLGKGFDERGINSKRMSLATGLEYRLFGFLPLRVGLRTGGYSSTTYSAGIGLSIRNFEFNVAASSSSNSANYGTNLGAAWSGLVFRF